jgi:hypothetical protein
MEESLFEGAPQGFAGADEMRLADQLVERSRADALSQWRPRTHGLGFFKERRDHRAGPA